MLSLYFNIFLSFPVIWMLTVILVQNIRKKVFFTVKGCAWHTVNLVAGLFHLWNITGSALIVLHTSIKRSLILQVKNKADVTAKNSFPILCDQGSTVIWMFILILLQLSLLKLQQQHIVLLLISKKEVLRHDLWI